MNTQDWSPLRWTGWISLQSKGLSRVFSNTTVQKHQLIDYTPMQNKKFEKIKKNFKKTSPSNARDAGLILELILQLSWSGS